MGVWLLLIGPVQLWAWTMVRPTLDVGGTTQKAHSLDGIKMRGKLAVSTLLHCLQPTLPCIVSSLLYPSPMPPTLEQADDRLKPLQIGLK